MELNLESDKLYIKILERIKKSKKYQGICEEIILEEIKKYFKLNSNLNFKSNLKTKISEKKLKLIIKAIKKELHLFYSCFQTKKKKKQRHFYLNELDKKIKNKKDLKEIQKTIDKLLSATISTKERLNRYPKIYRKIFEITKNPKIILDLGCGFNPFSFFYMGLKKLKYLAYDINENDINFLNKFFKIIYVQGLEGKAEILNIKNKIKISKLPKADIILLFKIIDLMDKKSHKQSEELIKQLISKAKFIIVSFPTTTITKKRMNFPKRKWFELMLNRINLKFRIFKTDNEIFYIIDTRK